MHEFKGKGGAPGSGSVEVDKKKRQMQALNDMCIVLFLYGIRWWLDFLQYHFYNYTSFQLVQEFKF